MFLVMAGICDGGLCVRDRMRANESLLLIDGYPSILEIFLVCSLLMSRVEYTYCNDLLVGILHRRHVILYD